MKKSTQKVIKKTHFLMANQKKWSKITEIDQKITVFKETQEKKELIFHIKKWPPQSACHGSGRWGQKGVKRGPYL